MEIKISEVPENLNKDAAKILAGELGFGGIFCDRMFVAKYSKEKGWYDAEIKGYENLSLDPAALVLHYAQEVFEGLKAYRLPDGGIGLFRPEMNAERMNASATRLVMPTMPVEDQLQAYDMLVRELKDWVPSHDGYSLYIRPTMIGTTPILGVKPSDEYLFYIICSPVSAYFKDGFKPIKVATSQKFVRAAIGGIGMAKTGGNYAASLLAAADAVKKGYDQVVWLDAVHHKYLEEMGGMNIFFVYGDTLKTAPLTGSILAGITRNSIITMAADMNLKVEEVSLDVNELCKDIESGACTEIFACGTAAVITAISNFAHADVDYQVGDGNPGEHTTTLYKTLTGIQEGKIEDKFGWSKRVV